MSEELKPCPFCGCEAKEQDIIIVGRGLCKMVFCEKCHIDFKNPTAIDRWNTRPVENKLSEKIKELNAEKARLLKAIDVIAKNAVDGLTIGIDFIGAGLDGMTGGQEDHDEMVEIRDIIAKFIKKGNRKNRKKIKMKGNKNVED